MKYCNIKKIDISNGPGIRCSLFVSGCEHHCPGCFNQKAWDFEYGEEFTDKTIQEILDFCKKPQIAGLSLLGGEPMHPRNEEWLIKLVKEFKQQFPEKTIWCWSGYNFEDLRTRSKLLPYIDVLIDGKFIQELRDVTLQYKGSSNQRVIDVQKSLKSNKIVSFTAK